MNKINYSEFKNIESDKVNQGNELYSKGDAIGALKAYMQALEINPHNHNIHYNIGNALYSGSHLMAARTAYAKAIELKPDYVPALCEMAVLLFYSSDYRGSVFYLNKLLDLNPCGELKIMKAICGLQNVFKTQEEIENSLASLDLALEQWQHNTAPATLPIPTLFALAYRYGDHTERFRRFGAGFVSVNAVMPPPVRARPRLMIVAAVYYPSVWEIILEGLMTHITQFEMVFLPLGRVENAWMSEAQNLSSFYFPRTANLGLAEAIINYMQPDIIFYPEIGMADIVLKLASMRFAPLQVASWGHQITTGMLEIDLFFSGELIEPDNADSHYTERLVKLPGTGSLTLAPKPLQPVRHGLDRDVVKFALCQSSFKYDPSDDELYIRIAKAVGRCEFWLLVDNNPAGAKLKARLIKSFWDNGIDPYIYLREFSFLDGNGFAGLLDELDIYLDCPVFSGYTTAHKAIQRGIPIVTLEGEFMRQRLAAGLLRQIGITDTITSTRDEYVALSARLAKESKIERILRRQAIKKASPKADNNIEVVRAFEQALIKAM